MKKSKKYDGIMVSSTFSDLKEHRKIAKDLIIKSGYFPNMMENDGARVIDVIESSLEKVRDSSVYMNVISKKYGTVYEKNSSNPKKLSLTELEFDEAIKYNRPILLFVMGINHPILENDIESDKIKKRKLDAFREKAKKMNENSDVTRVYAEFNNIEDFKEKLSSALKQLPIDLKKDTTTKQKKEFQPKQAIKNIQMKKTETNKKKNSPPKQAKVIQVRKTKASKKEEEVNNMPIEIFPLSKKEGKEKYKDIIANAPENSEIYFISVTARNDLYYNDNDEMKHFIEAWRNNVSFKGIVFDPNGLEAKFRNTIESPGQTLKKTILYKGASDVKDALGGLFWKGKNIEMRYAKIGLPFKLWISDDEAFIEPYHIGKTGEVDANGLCGFSRTLYKKGTEEYKRLKSHFEELWERSDSFWPEKKINDTLLFNRVEIEINTGCNKEEYCSFCPNKNKKIENEDMKEELYEKIISQLVGLKFSGRISFHFYGEPLVSKDLCRRIEYANQKFTEAKLDVKLVIYTNGEKLNQAIYDKLERAGISKIFISIAPNSTPSLNIKNLVGEKHIILEDTHYDNRAGNLYETDCSLTVPCFAPTHRLVIAHNGDVLLCYADFERKNVFGNVNKELIENIWQNKHFVTMRNNLQKGERSEFDPCKYCDNQAHRSLGQANVNVF